MCIRDRVNLIGNAAYRQQKSPGAMNQHTDAVTGEVSRDFDINPYSYAINSSRALDPNTYYLRNYAPFNIHNELANNYNDYDVIDMKVQAELKYKPITKVELAVLGAYKFSTTTQANRITDQSNMAMAYRAMDDATMRDNNPWLYTDPDKPNTKPFSVLPKGGFYRETKYKMNSWDFRATASYNDVYANDHIVNVFGGMEVNNTDRSKSYFNGVGMQYDMGFLGDYDYRYFKQASEENSIYYSLDNTYNREVSFFGTITYSWKGRYTINGTTRYEGSNRLGKARSARWLPTWNVSGSWNASEEPWFKKTFNNALTHAMVRTSYSLTADPGPATYTNSTQILKAYTPYRIVGTDKESGIMTSELENSQLTYEKKHEFNIGSELGFLNNRINVTFDFFWRNNFDLIGPIATQGVGGQVIRYANTATMKSQGQELSVQTTNIKNNNLTWVTNVIFSHVTTEVTSLMSQARTIDLVNGEASSGFTMEGYPHRAIFSMPFQGLTDKGIPTYLNEKGELTSTDLDFQNRNSNGYLIYEGPTEPTITGSLGNEIKWKNWRLNVFLTYSFGSYVRLDLSLIHISEPTRPY